MATLLSDNFDRANSATVIGPPQTGPSPVMYSGTGGISGNQMYQAVAGTMVAGWDLGTPDVELTVNANSVSASNGVSLALGIVSATNHWYFYAQTNLVQLVRANPGGLYVVAPGSGTKLPAASSVLRMHYRGGVIRCYVDGVLVIRWAVDAPITATVHGVRCINTAVRVDNLLGTDAPVIAEDYAGGLPSAGLTYAGGQAVVRPSFVYRGRDTKIQDNTAGA